MKIDWILGATPPPATVTLGDQLVLALTHGGTTFHHRTGDGLRRTLGDAPRLAGGDHDEVVRTERVQLLADTLLGPHVAGRPCRRTDAEPGQSLEHLTIMDQRPRHNRFCSSFHNVDVVKRRTERGGAAQRSS